MKFVELPQHEYRRFLSDPEIAKAYCEGLLVIWDVLQPYSLLEEPSENDLNWNEAFIKSMEENISRKNEIILHNIRANFEAAKMILTSVEESKRLREATPFTDRLAVTYMDLRRLIGKEEQ